MLTIFGSCRVDILSGNKLNRETTFTHCTKEVIQLIDYLEGRLQIPYPINSYCFRDSIINQKVFLDKKSFGEVFANSSICLVEICSMKKYMIGPYYLHSLAVDKRVENYKFTPREIIDNHIISIQSPKELEEDILQIQKMIYPRKLILVSHYNALLHGKIIPSRDLLINLLQKISDKYGIFLINPNQVLKEWKQEEVMQEDLGHYTDFGKQKMFEYLELFIKFL